MMVPDIEKKICRKKNEDIYSQAVPDILEIPTYMSIEQNKMSPLQKRKMFSLKIVGLHFPKSFSISFDFCSN